MPDNYTVSNYRKIDLSDHASDMLAILLEQFNQGRQHKLNESQMITLLLSDAVLQHLTPARAAQPHAKARGN
jgi:hypothetical protein